MKKISEQMVEWIKCYFKQNGDENTKAIIGISGGKDSSVVAAACAKALGNDRVIGVMMPNGEQKDIEDSKRLIKHLGIQSYEVNIGDTYNALSNTILNTVDNQLTNQFKTNTPSRLRMVTLYAIAAQIGNCRISCNGNMDEVALGYFTLWGDGAGDFAPLINMHVSEVRKAGIELGLPEELVMKAPSDGMCGKTDEEQLGVTYDAVERTIEKTEYHGKAGKIISAMSWKKKLLNLPSFQPLRMREEKALVIVDAQKDFINGAMGVGLEKWGKAKTKILELINGGGYDHILFTVDWHPYDHCSFKDNGGQWPRHCVQHTEGAAIDDGLLNAAMAQKSKKGFFHKGESTLHEEYASMTLCNWLSICPQISNIDIVGLVREYCVEMTKDAIERSIGKSNGVNVNIIEEGTVKLNE